MKAVVKESGKVLLKEISLPEIKSHEVLIQVKFAGICRTDEYVAQNKISTKTPLILGHEFSGTISKIGSNVRSLEIGDPVTSKPFTETNDFLGKDIDGAFAQYIKIPENIVYKIPNGVDLKTAILTEPVAAMLAVLKAPISKEQKGVLCGDNRISRLTLSILKNYGFSNISILSKEELTKVPSNSFDFSIETTNKDNIFQEIVRTLKREGTLVLKSRYFEPIAFPVGMIVQKEIKCFGVHYGSFSEALNLLAENKLNVDDIFGDVYPLEEAIELLMKETNMADSKKTILKIS